MLVCVKFYEFLHKEKTTMYFKVLFVCLYLFSLFTVSWILPPPFFLFMSIGHNKLTVLYLWFRASLIEINNSPTRCNTKQSIYYSASSLYLFRVSTTPIIRSTQNCNYTIRYCAATSLQRGQAWPCWREVAAQKNMNNTGGCSYSFV